jgi:putative glutathione S-transferase
MAYMKQGVWQESSDPSKQLGLDNFNNFAMLEKDRFHLYVSYGCPFAHRAILAISLLGLEEYVGVSSVTPLKNKNGWEFDVEFPDSVNANDFLYQVYRDAKEDYSGRASVPVLWDKKRNTIVSNDSLAIAKWFATQQISLQIMDLIPASLKEEITEQCAWINENLNNLPFKAGFTNDQTQYEESALAFFHNLSALDDRLVNKRFYNGDVLTLSDILIFPTLIQFELVYHTHFKLNLHTLSHYKNIQKYVVELMRDERISSTFHIDFIKKSYFAGQSAINPSGLIPIGPTLKGEG